MLVMFGISLVNAGVTYVEASIVVTCQWPKKSVSIPLLKWCRFFGPFRHFYLCDATVVSLTDLWCRSFFHEDNKELTNFHFFSHVFFPFFFPIFSPFFFVFVGLRKHPQEKNAGGKDKDALGWALKVRFGDLGVGGGGFNINPKRAISLCLSLSVSVYIFFIYVICIQNKGSWPFFPFERLFF